MFLKKKNNNLIILEMEKKTIDITVTENYLQFEITNITNVKQVIIKNEIIKITLRVV